jgi:hypothetical protein
MKPGHALLLLFGLLPASFLLAGSLVIFIRTKNACSLLQLLGSGCLILVVMAHVFEALHLFPWMGWGLEHSIGHYFDLCSAVLGSTVFPAGYLLQALADRRSQRSILNVG